MSLMTIPTKLLTKVSGLNWYAVGLKVVLLLGLVTAVHYHAIYSCEKKHNEEQVAQANAKAATVVADVSKRLPDVARADQDSAKRRADAALSGEKLDEAVKANPNGSCTLSDDELRYYRELADKTRRSN